MKSLGLDKPLFEPKEKPKKAKADPKKRKITAEADQAPLEVAKVPRTTLVDADVRRSSRNAGKRVDYNAVQQPKHSLLVSFSSGVKITENTGPLGREDGIRNYDPCAFFPSAWLLDLHRLFAGSPMVPYQELKLALGGRLARGAAATPYTRRTFP